MFWDEGEDVERYMDIVKYIKCYKRCHDEYVNRILWYREYGVDYSGD